jgi:hypothetical protein
MNKEIKEKWVKALRSGEYKQGTTNLYDKDRHTYCCLGVLAKISGYHPNTVKRKGEEYLAATKEREFGLDYDLQQKLGRMNDGSAGYDRYSFPQIADWIEKNL